MLNQLFRVWDLQGRDGLLNASWTKGVAKVSHSVAIESY